LASKGALTFASLSNKAKTSRFARLRAGLSITRSTRSGSPPVAQAATPSSPRP
jgi:hypothetical protein